MNLIPHCELRLNVCENDMGGWKEQNRFYYAMLPTYQRSVCECLIILHYLPINIFGWIYGIRYLVRVNLAISIQRHLYDDAMNFGVSIELVEFF